MALEGKLRLKVTDKHGNFLNEEVEICLTHMKLSPQAKVRRQASEEIEIVGLHTVTEGMYKLEVIASPFEVKNQFVTILASSTAALKRCIEGSKPLCQ